MIRIILAVLCLTSVALGSSEGLVVIKNDMGDPRSLGVLIDKEKGWILAALHRPFSHLIAGGFRMYSAFGHTPCEMVAEDPLYNLAIFEVADRSLLEKMQAFSLAQTFTGLGESVALTEDDFSLRKQKEAASMDAVRDYCAYPAQNVMLHNQDTPFLPIESGTVLLNKNGEVMSLLQRVKQEGGWIPLNALHDICARAKSSDVKTRFSKRSLLGVRLRYFDISEAKALIGAQSYAELSVLIVSSVYEHGFPQGLRPGDIIVAINGIRVAGSFDKLLSAIQQAQGQTACCDIIRFGEPMQVDTPLEDAHNASQTPFYLLKDLYIFNVNRRLCLEYGLPEGSCLLATAADKYPLELLSINGQKILFKDFERLIAEKPTTAAIITVKHQDGTYTFQYPPGEWGLRRLDPRAPAG